jgi:hypothetical protein
VAPIDSHRVLSILRRRLFTCLTILSLLLCLATVGLWVRSYWAADFAGRYNGRGRIFALVSTMGSIEISATPSGNGSFAGVYYGRDKADRWGSVASTMRFGAHFGPIESWVLFPHWFAGLLFAVLPTLRLRAILRTRRENRIGLCQHCGYDLRATPDRCPECGHIPTAAAIR